MKYDNSILLELENFIDEYLIEQEKKYSDKGESGLQNDAAMDKIEHIKRTVMITNMISNNDSMARVAAKFHDIGRFPQLEILGGFRDDIILHHNLGEDFITRQVFQKKLKPSMELDAIRQAVMYHGRMQFIPFVENPLTNEAKEITEVISRSDDLDNGCIGALGYIERETLTDAKGYKQKNPELDQTLVSENVKDFFRRGEKFNKLTECHTYADYILFAAVLAIQALKGKDYEVAQSVMEMKCFNYDNALEGYQDLFNRYIEPSFAKEAYDILYSYYSRNYENNLGVEHTK